MSDTPEPEDNGLNSTSGSLGATKSIPPQEWRGETVRRLDNTDTNGGKSTMSRSESRLRTVKFNERQATSEHVLNRAFEEKLQRTKELKESLQKALEKTRRNTASMRIEAEFLGRMLESKLGMTKDNDARIELRTTRPAREMTADTPENRLYELKATLEESQASIQVMRKRVADEIARSEQHDRTLVADIEDKQAGESLDEKVGKQYLIAEETGAELPDLTSLEVEPELKTVPPEWIKSTDQIVSQALAHLPVCRDVNAASMNLMQQLEKKEAWGLEQVRDALDLKRRETAELAAALKLRLMAARAEAQAAAQTIAELEATIESKQPPLGDLKLRLKERNARPDREKADDIPEKEILQLIASLEAIIKSLEEQRDECVARKGSLDADADAIAADIADKELACKIDGETWATGTPCLVVKASQAPPPPRRPYGRVAKFTQYPTDAPPEPGDTVPLDAGAPSVDWEPKECDYEEYLKRTRAARTTAVPTVASTGWRPATRAAKVVARLGGYRP